MCSEQVNMFPLRLHFPKLITHDSDPYYWSFETCPKVLMLWSVKNSSKLSFLSDILLSESSVVVCGENTQWRIQGGAPGMRAPLGLNSFIFVQFSAKILQNNRLAHPPVELASPSGNPDPPVILVFPSKNADCWIRLWLQYVTQRGQLGKLSRLESTGS